MTGWENFFIAEVGASAALAGLIFVGVSINLNRILSLPRLPNRALLALILLLTILIVSSLLLVPGQSLILIGIELLFIGLVTWILATVLDIRTLQKTEARYRRSFASTSMILTQLAALPYVIAGAILLISGANGLYWLVPAVIFSFIKTIVDAWVLLVEINR
jgi:modulator of FtsH protease